MIVGRPYRLHANQVNSKVTVIYVAKHDGGTNNLAAGLVYPNCYIIVSVTNLLSLKNETKISLEETGRKLIITKILLRSSSGASYYISSFTAAYEKQSRLLWHENSFSSF